MNEQLRIFNAEFGEALNEGLAEIADLPGIDRDDIINEFAIGSAFICVSVHTYGGYWLKEHWNIVKYSDPDCDHVALRSQADESCNRFDNSHQEQSLHDRLTWDWYRPASPVRLDLDNFRAGTPVTKCLVLEQLSCEVYLAPNIERKAEMLHALMHRLTVYKNVSGPGASLSLRHGQAHDLVANPETHDQFVKTYSKFNSACKIAIRLGFPEHPLWKSLVQRRKNGEYVNFGQAASYLMYSLDPQSRYFKNAAIKEVAKRQAKERKKKLEAWYTSVKQGKEKLSEALITANAMREHVMTEINAQQIWSLPASASCFMGMTDLDSRQPMPQRERELRPNRRRKPLRPEITPQQSDDGGVGSQQLYFKLVKKQPGKGTHIRPSDLMYSWFLNSNIAVTLHEPLGDGLCALKPAMSPGSAHGVVILRLCADQAETIEAGLQVWDSSSRVFYVLPGVTIEGNLGVIRLMVNTAAYEGSDRFFLSDPADIAMGSIFDQMSALGYLKKWGEGKSQFTQYGPANIKIGTPTCNPRQFLALDDNKEFSSCSSWESIKHMKNKHWTWKRSPSSKEEQAALPPFAPHLHDDTTKEQPLAKKRRERTPTCASKLWYTLTMVQNEYLISLLIADTLFANGTKQILHCQPKLYYAKVLDHSIDGSEPLPVDDAKPKVAKSKLQVEPLDNINQTCEQHERDQLLRIEDQSTQKRKRTRKASQKASNGNSAPARRGRPRKQNPAPPIVTHPATAHSPHDTMNYEHNIARKTPIGFKVHLVLWANKLYFRNSLPLYCFARGM